MRRVLSMLLVLAFIGCGGVKKPNTTLVIPELNRSEYYDSPYLEGWADLKDGKARVAMKKFEQSNVEDEKLYLAFGYTFLVQNRLDLARQNFDKTLAIDPENLQAEIGMATVFEAGDDLESAYRVYTRLMARYPENSWIRARVDYIRSAETGRLMKMAEEFKKRDDRQRYIQSLEKAAFYADDSMDIKMKIADYYLSSGDFERAAACYENIIEKQPYQEEILTRLAGLYEEMEKYDAAIVVYNRILEMHPGDLSLSQKIEDIKVKFYDTNLPVKFKNIFFKYSLNREDLAALIGHYFRRFLELDTTPVILTDISGSFAKDEIILLCTLNIMDYRPDHRFERYTDINRSDFAVVLNALIDYMRRSGFSIEIHSPGPQPEPGDISPMHKYYSIIKYVTGTQIMKLDPENRFNPMEKVSPSEGLAALRKILNHIQRLSR